MPECAFALLIATGCAISNQRGMELMEDDRSACMRAYIRYDRSDQAYYPTTVQYATAMWLVFIIIIIADVYRPFSCAPSCVYKSLSARCPESVLWRL